MGAKSKKGFQNYSFKNTLQGKLSVNFAFLFIGLLIFLALFADLLANETPLLAKHKGSTIYAPIPYSSTTLDLENAGYKSPFDMQPVKSSRWRHWLGTDKVGRDTLAGLIHAVRISFLVGIISLLVSFFLGIMFGVISGYFGDRTLSVQFSVVFTSIISTFLFFYYAFFIRRYEFMQSPIKQLGIVLLYLAAFSLLGFFTNLLFQKLKFLSRKVFIPLDILIHRFIEIFTSIPKLFIVLFLFVLFTPSIYYLGVLIGAFYWPVVAKLVRAEMIKIKKLNYIETAKSLGNNTLRIIFIHALPNALTPLYVVLAFGFADSIVLESSLSFLGFGVPVETITWGKMMAMARGNYNAWWLILFPGMFLFLSILSIYIIANSLKVKTVEREIN